MAGNPQLIATTINYDKISPVMSMALRNVPVFNNTCAVLQQQHDSLAGPMFYPKQQSATQLAQINNSIPQSFDRALRQCSAVAGDLEQYSACRLAAVAANPGVPAALADPAGGCFLGCAGACKSSGNPTQCLKECAVMCVGNTLDMPITSEKVPVSW